METLLENSTQIFRIILYSATLYFAIRKRNDWLVVASTTLLLSSWVQTFWETWLVRSTLITIMALALFMVSITTERRRK